MRSPLTNPFFPLSRRPRNPSGGFTGVHNRAYRNRRLPPRKPSDGLIRVRTSSPLLSKKRPYPRPPRESSDNSTSARTSSARSPETPHTSAQTFRRLHSRAPCACFVAAFIESADYPRICRASPPVALPRCAAVRRRFASPPRLSVRRSGVSADIPASRRPRRSPSAERTARSPEALSTSASAAQALRRLHSRAPCACFVAALIGTAAHLRKPSGGFTKVRSRSPQVRFAAALIGSAVWRISRYSSFASPA